MRKRLLIPALLYSLLLGWTSMVMAGEESSFVKLDAKQIRARFPGKELTDELHYAYRFDRNGRIAIAVAIGEDRQGKWRTYKDTLCLVLDQQPAQTGENCYEVWMAGASVELRTGGEQPMSSIIGKLLKPNAVP